jgi:hypothetical protein
VAVVSCVVPVGNVSRLLYPARSRWGTYRGCCILRGPGGERIVAVVPGGMKLELQVKTGSWAGRTHSQ